MLCRFHRRVPTDPGDKVHAVYSAEGSWYRQTYGEVFCVNSAHHQALDKLGEAADVLRELAQCAQLQEGQLALILRILGVALVSELAAQACRDAGEEGLALHVETGAKVILLLLSAPLLRQLAGLVMELTA